MSAPLLFALAAAAGAAGTLAARALAPRLGMVSHPNPIVAQHTRAVACLGGAGIAAGVAAALLAARAGGTAFDAGGLPLPALALGAAAFLALGAWDDRRPLRPLPKLLLQSLAAAGAAAGGIVLPVTGITLADAALSALWIVAVVNAVNLTDVSDGVAGGTAAVAFLALAADRPELRGVALAAAGATAGFLLFNLPPASVFLGDSGSHLLGFLLAALTLADARGFPPLPAAARCALLAGVFLFELVFLVGVRTRKGLPWWRGSPDHFSLRLQAAGRTRGETAAVAWASAAALGAAAALLPRLSAGGQAVLAIVVLAALAAAWRALLRWEVPPRRSSGIVEGR